MKRHELLVNRIGAGAIISVAGISTVYDPSALKDACSLVGAIDAPCQIQTEEPQREPRPIRAQVTIAVSSASASNAVAFPDGIFGPIFTTKT